MVFKWAKHVCTLRGHSSMSIHSLLRIALYESHILVPGIGVLVLTERLMTVKKINVESERDHI